jgi:hypothetical protein
MVAHPRDPGLWSLDHLARLDHAALDALYRASDPPALADLDAVHDARMLAVRRLDGPRGLRRVARLAASRAFPWRGKAFESTGPERGAGLNRIVLAGRHFPFATRVEPSALDGRPAVLLDYDDPRNPWVIRKVRDELRTVAPGLFLGPAMWKARGGPRTVLWFAVSAG